jgi:hypothetical protein
VNTPLENFPQVPRVFAPPDLSEKAFTAQAIGPKAKPGLARLLGFTCYHTLRSKGSEAGYPDWTLARERVVFLELKTETGKVSDAQAYWVDVLVRAGAEIWVARPRHLQELAWWLAARRPAVERGQCPYGDTLFDELDAVLARVPRSEAA